ncbi:hypothetical protein FGO68_gene8573 [Halteria grandinella]|uniref:Uncharacterized protein n=1 Tax=Halteria grandinella TaxID=5974 RepID=A0A8J8NHM5_HALGN|nr:hypothetical protein FGO68_gene8573 [Halteria grandinella]
MNYSPFDLDHSEYSSPYVFPDQNQEVSPLDNFMQANPQPNKRESYALKFQEEDSEMIFTEHDDEVQQCFSEQHGVVRQGCSQIPEEPADLIPHIFSRHGKTGQKRDSEIKLVSNFIKGYEELIQSSAEAFPEMQASGNLEKIMSLNLRHMFGYANSQK